MFIGTVVGAALLVVFILWFLLGSGISSARHPQIPVPPGVVREKKLT
jgi:hypothetical protein